MIKRTAALLFLSLFAGVASAASPCTGNFEMNGNGYGFDLRLDYSFDGIVGYMTQISSPNDHWAPASTVQGTCDGNRMHLQRTIDTGVQHYIMFPDGRGGWVGTFTSPSMAGRYNARIYPR